MSNTVNIFELASKKKLRYASLQGELTTEQLWDLPLSSKTGRDLDTVGTAIKREIRNLSEDSLVATKPSARKIELELQLEVIISIIATKQAEAADRARKAEKAEKRAKILDLVGKKEDTELANKSKEELLKELADLDD